MSHRVTESVVVNVNKNGLRQYTTATKVKPTFHQNTNPFTFVLGVCALCCFRPSIQMFCVTVLITTCWYLKKSWGGRGGRRR